MTRSRQNITIAVLLCVAVALIYFPAADYAFISVDDPDNITANPVLREGLSRAGIHWAMTAYLLGHWTPLVRLTYLADQSLFGLNPGVMHVEDIAWHAGASVMLFVLLLSATGAAWRSAIVAGLFAVHPMHVESVVWVTERRDVMSTFFLFAAMWAYVRYAGDWTGGRFGWYALALVIYGLSLLSKAMGITLPVLLLLMDYWPLNRISIGLKVTSESVAGAEVGRASARHLRSRRAEARPTLLAILVEKIPFAAMAAPTAFVAMQAQRATNAAASVDALPIAARLANLAVTFPTYVIKLAVPTQLSFFYPHPGDRPIATVFAGAALLAGITIFVLLQWKSRRYLAVGWLWFLVALLPVSGLAQSGPQAMADRYSYLPSVGLFVAVVWCIGELVNSGRELTRIATSLAMLVIVAFAALAGRQVRYWQDSVTLFRHAIDVTGSNWLAHWGLGDLARDRGDVATAIDEYHRSIADREINFHAYAALGNIWRSNPAVAVKYYRKAVEYAPHPAPQRVALARMLMESGQLNEAETQLRTALAEEPDNADALIGLKDVTTRLRAAGGQVR